MSPTENTDNGKALPEELAELEQRLSFYKKLTGKKKGPRNQKSKRMKKRNKGMTLIETGIVTAILGLGSATAVSTASKIIGSAEAAIESVSPANLEQPFGVVTEEQEEQAAAILSRAVGDLELEIMARSCSTPEDIESLRIAVLEKYHYHTAAARSNRALEMMNRGD